MKKLLKHVGLIPKATFKWRDPNFNSLKFWLSSFSLVVLIYLPVILDTFYPDLPCLDEYLSYHPYIIGFLFLSFIESCFNYIFQKVETTAEKVCSKLFQGIVLSALALYLPTLTSFIANLAGFLLSSFLFRIWGSWEKKSI
ncbi:hypothetical protein [Lonepinella sp. BR2271]|uniref:hypothetical protein n=1 Tax=Lonepinella sp. BR2271 TaxID=3434550 RepID=UPI003F6E2C4B